MSAAIHQGSRKRSCSSVPQRTSGPRYGSRQQRATSARTSSACTSAIRGCGGISNARSSTTPRRPRSRVGAEELVDAELGPVRVAGEVDEEVAEQAVDQPGQARRALGLQPVELGERDLQLVEAVVAPLVDARRLARRAHEAAGEQVGERRVVLPERDEAAQQVRAAQERAVGGRPAAEGDVVAAAGARVEAVERELLGAEADPLAPHRTALSCARPAPPTTRSGGR